jgi:hypothetical protein
VPQARFLLPINPELLLPVCPLLGTNIQKRRISDFGIAGFADSLNKVCRFTCKRLFVSQRDHGIDARGAASGNIAGQNGHASQHKRYGGEGYGIARPNSVE